MGKYALAVIAGLLAAAATVFVALLMVGGGHGWVAPFFFSLALFLIYPAIGLLWARQGLSLWPAVALSGIAVASDVLLFRNILWEEAQYFQLVGGVAYIWLLFWFAWQAILAMTVMGILDRRDRVGGW